MWASCDLTEQYSQREPVLSLQVPCKDLQPKGPTALGNPALLPASEVLLHSVLSFLSPSTHGQVTALVPWSRAVLLTCGLHGLQAATAEPRAGLSPSISSASMAGVDVSASTVFS